MKADDQDILCTVFQMPIRRPTFVQLRNVSMASAAIAAVITLIAGRPFSSFAYLFMVVGFSCLISEVTDGIMKWPAQISGMILIFATLVAFLEAIIGALT